MLEYGKSGIYNNNRLPAEKKKEEENTRDRSVPDGSDKERVPVPGSLPFSITCCLMRLLTVSACDTWNQRL